MKRFKRWEVKDQLEISNDDMKYVIVEPNRSPKTLRMNLEYAKMSKLEHYMASILTA